MTWHKDNETHAVAHGAWRSASLEWTLAFNRPIVSTPFLVETVPARLLFDRGHNCNLGLFQETPLPCYNHALYKKQQSSRQSPALAQTTFYRLIYSAVSLSLPFCQYNSWERTTLAFQLSADTYLLLHQIPNMNFSCASQFVSSTADCW